MHGKHYSQAMSVIQAKLQLCRTGIDRETGVMNEGMMVLFGVVLRKIDDQDGPDAVVLECLESEYPPTPGAILKRYAKLKGCADGESPSDAIARRQREEQAREDLRRSEKHFREENERKYGELVRDPERFGNWLSQRGFVGESVKRLLAPCDSPSGRNQIGCALSAGQPAPMADTGMAATAAPQAPDETEWNRRLRESGDDPEARNAVIDEMVSAVLQAS